MNDILRVGVVPVDIAFADKLANISAAVAGAADIAAECDIIVLPELFSTGYVNDAALMSELAEGPDGATMVAVREIAAQSDAAVAGSYVASGPGGLCYNRAFFVRPDGSAVFYDKRHLFSMSRESEIFGRGDSPVPVVQWRGWNVAVSVCYDLRFPVWLRNRAYAYDLMLIPANWPRARVYALEHLLIARAIENQAAVVCANRSGADAYGVYDGCSFAFDHMGRPAFSGDSLVAQFSLEALRKAREKFPAAKDADDFCIL